MKETECNEQPVDYSSTVIASIVKALTGTQSTTMDIPFVSSVIHTNIATLMIKNQLELMQFFSDYKIPRT